MIFVNFKTYSQGSGKKAVKLAKICQEVAQERKIPIIPLVQAFDIFRISQEVKIPPWLQHLDWHPQDQCTGWLNLEGALEAGAKGTILNHSEHKLPFGTIRRTIKRIRKTNPQGYRARIRNHGHSCFLCEIVIRSQFHTTYEPEA
jgi:Triosephosphate isomerase